MSSQLDALTRFGLRLTSDGSGCWIMGGSPASNGYFQFGAGGRYQSAHRWSWQNVAELKLDPALDIEHLCNQPACQRPGHMDLVTRQENIRRKWERKRLLIPEDLVWSGPCRTRTISELMFGIEHCLPTVWSPTAAELASKSINLATGKLS